MVHRYLKNLILLAPAISMMGCDKEPGPAAPKLGMLNAQIQTIQKTCLGLDPNTSKIAVVRVVVPDPFDPAIVRRDVRIGFPVVSSPANAENDVLESAPISLGNDLQPFHVNLVGVDIRNAKWVKIKIILKDPRYTFKINPDPEQIEDPNKHRDLYVGRGLEYGNGPHSQFCGPDIGETTNIDANKTYEFVSFFIKTKKAGVKRRAGYSFRLIPKSAPETPIFVDPKIHNEG